jgi:hypothetical protein
LLKKEKYLRGVNYTIAISKLRYYFYALLTVIHAIPVPCKNHDKYCKCLCKVPYQNTTL